MNDVHFVDDQTKQIVQRGTSGLVAASVAAIALFMLTSQRIPEIREYAAAAPPRSIAATSTPTVHRTAATQPARKAASDSQPAKNPPSESGPPEHKPETPDDNPTPAVNPSQSLTEVPSGDPGSARGEAAYRYEFEDFGTYFYLAKKCGAVFVAIDRQTNFPWRLGDSLDGPLNPQLMNSAEVVNFSKRQAVLHPSMRQLTHLSEQLAMHGLALSDIVLLIPHEIDAAILEAQNRFHQQAASHDIRRELVTRIRISSTFPKPRFSVIDAYALSGH